MCVRANETCTAGAQNFHWIVLQPNDPCVAKAHHAWPFTLVGNCSPHHPTPLRQACPHLLQRPAAVTPSWMPRCLLLLQCQTYRGVAFDDACYSRCAPAPALGTACPTGASISVAGT